MNLTAEESRRRLEEGNLRFLRDTPRAEGRDGAARAMLAKSQDPFAVILCCADSRVVPEIAFDAGLGELFVIRVAGNVANKATIASVEFAVANLGTKLVVVMAHANCGAVAAAIGRSDASPHLRYLLEHIEPAVEGSGHEDVDTVARRNAELTVRRMTAESEIIRIGAATGGVEVVTAFYTPGTGRVDLG
jgi:carbonic anhydrase